MGCDYYNETDEKGEIKLVVHRDGSKVERDITVPPNSEVYVELGENVRCR